MTVRKILSLFFLFFPFLGWTYSDFVPLKERAQGHSLTGALQANESVYSNPAGTLFTETYSIDGTFAFPKSFSASIVDTRTNSIGGGIGYFKEQGLDSTSLTHGIRLTAGSRLSQKWAWGLAGKAIWGKRTDQDLNYKDADAGVLWNGDVATVGLVLRNVFGGNLRFNQEREISAGARVGYSQTFYLSGSVHSKFEKVAPYEYGFGVEYVSPWHFSLMGGYRFQVGKKVENPSYWSTGVSFLSPRLSLHYAAEFPQLNNEETAHLLGLSMLF